MIPDAIEEMMRAYAAVTTFRTCVNPVTLGEVTFQPGDKIAMPTCLAGRDPEYYEDANKVILNRKARYLSFGYGQHQIGRASCRERVCQYVYMSVVAVSQKKNKKIKQ